MNQSAEVFQIGGQISGILVRCSTASELTTRLFFQTPDGDNSSLIQTTWFEGGDWTRFSYTENGEEILLHRSDLSKPPAPASAGRLDQAIPSYAAHGVLTRLLRDGGESADFVQFQESVHPVPQESRFVVEGFESIRIGNQALVTKKVQLYSDGKRSNTFWTLNEAVVKSDWGGAESYLVNDVESALDAMGTALRSKVQKFLSTSR